MNKSLIIKWGFRTLCMIGLVILLCTDSLTGQTKPQSKSKVVSITDDNFKKKIAKGFVLVHLTAPYQMATLDKKLFDGITKFEGCIVYKTDHSNVKKVVKKLRIRNYPSLALFHNGKKINVWKADMDGIVDVTNKHIKKAISDALAGDVF
jgi:thioredoxin-like negative regulator of GroEL